jgi:hypothetical protein
VAGPYAQVDPTTVEGSALFELLKATAETYLRDDLGLPPPIAAALGVVVAALATRATTWQLIGDTVGGVASLARMYAFWGGVAVEDFITSGGIGTTGVAIGVTIGAVGLIGHFSAAINAVAQAQAGFNKDKENFQAIKNGFAPPYPNRPSAGGNSTGGSSAGASSATGTNGLADVLADRAENKPNGWMQYDGEWIPLYATDTP